MMDWDIQWTDGKVQGFIPTNFWESIEYARELPTAQPFFTDPNFKILVANYDHFCRTFKPQSYEHPPDNCSIPPILHFVWLGSNVPEKVIYTRSTWEKCHPGWTIKTWTEEEVKNFKWSNGYSKLAFNLAESWAEKSDILRYEILLQEGGIYADVDFICLKSFNDLIGNGIKFFTGQEINQIGTRDKLPLYVANGLMGAEKGSEIVAECIKRIKIQDESPNEPMLYRTGPVLLTRVCHDFISQGNGENLLVLPCSYFYPLPYFKNMSHKRLVPKEIKNSYLRPESLVVHLWWETWKK